MASDPRISQAAADAMADAYCDLLNGGVLKIFDGTIPATCETADDGTQLTEHTLSATFETSVADGDPGAVITVAAIGDDDGLATGTAQYFRLYASGGSTCHYQDTVGTSGEGLNLDNTSIATDQTVSISSFTITVNET